MNTLTSHDRQRTHAHRMTSAAWFARNTLRASRPSETRHGEGEKGSSEGDFFSLREENSHPRLVLSPSRVSEARTICDANDLRREATNRSLLPSLPFLYVERGRSPSGLESTIRFGAADRFPSGSHRARHGVVVAAPSISPTSPNSCSSASSYLQDGAVRRFFPG